MKTTLNPLRWNLSLSLVVCCLSSVSAFAGPRSAGPYSIPADSVDSGGGRATSVNYTVDQTLGDIGDIQASSPYANKAGYPGTLTDPRSIQLNASPTNVNEGATRQLGAVVVNDDASQSALSPASVAWSVLSGPLASINSTGLATAALVFTNTGAIARGSYLSFSNTLALIVLDSIPDNFGIYAGDGLDDSWQAAFFGTNSPLAGPLMDPDGDGQNNAFEFTTGTVPTVSSNRFVIVINPVSGQPTKKDIAFNPRFTNRTYFVETSTSLLGWTNLVSTTTNDVSTTRTVTDQLATQPNKFYRVRVTKP